MNAKQIAHDINEMIVYGEKDLLLYEQANGCRLRVEVTDIDGDNLQLFVMYEGTDGGDYQSETIPWDCLFIDGVVEKEVEEILREGKYNWEGRNEECMQ